MSLEGLKKVEGKGSIPRDIRKPANLNSIIPTSHYTTTSNRNRDFLQLLTNRGHIKTRDKDDCATIINASLIPNSAKVFETKKPFIPFKLQGIKEGKTVKIRIL